jgi:dienelactone hydrolase
MTKPLGRIDTPAAEQPQRKGTEQLDAAMVRAYPIERCLDYGCSVDDVTKLRKRVVEGASWSNIACQLASDDLLRAAIESKNGYRASAMSFTLNAAACFRLAQSALEDDAQQRLQTYVAQSDAFTQAMELASQQVIRFDVLHETARHACWLYPAPEDETGKKPCVVVWGGADGWCEAFYGSVADYTARGLSVCLIELPGQGLARLRDGSALKHDFTAMVSALLDELSNRGFGRSGFGVAGHSLGGTMALAAAAADDRFVACCTNGGSVVFERGLAKYPRVLQRFGRMLGDVQDPNDMIGFIKDLGLEAAVPRMRANVLCLQGGKDVLVADDEAHHLVQLRGKAHASLELWPDGVHCLYDFSTERNAVMTGWFASQWID